MTAQTLAQHFNWVDYTILGVVVLSTIISFFRGFLREAVSLVVWIVGILLALKFAGVLQVHLQSWINSPGLRYGLSFVAIFLAVFIVGIIFNALIHTIVSKTGLSVTDRFLGIFFGAARGLLIASVLLIFFSASNINGGNAAAQSRLAPKLAPIVNWLNRFLPQQVKQFSEWVGETSDGNAVDLGNHE